jgi:hypothetical protein
MSTGKLVLPMPWQLRDMIIDGAIVNTLSFQAFSDYVTEAQSMKKPKTFEGRLRRLRLAKQVVYYINGSTTPVLTDDIVEMPIPNARMLTEHLDEDEGKAGKIIKEGDGIEKSIIYEFGTPIPVGEGKEPIRELEFIAKTYGDIEDVMSAPDSVQQTAMLIATVGKPPGMLQLPSWALTRITVADGVTIAKLVTPIFLGLPDESQNE